MMSTTNRFTAVFYAVVGLGIFAVAFFAPNPNLLFALRILLATAAVFLAVHGIFRRDLAILVMAAGLGSLAVDAFTLNPIFRYLGFALVFASLFLNWRAHHGTPTTPQAGV
ncbi:MAG TPA: hypothetical protein VII30_06705 [Gemmatimonadaceae bacterium]